jgi:hypothetical protein
MYTNQRHARACVSDDSVMQDVMTEIGDMCVSVLRVGASRMRLSHVVVDTIFFFQTLIFLWILAKLPVIFLEILVSRYEHVVPV